MVNKEEARNAWKTVMAFSMSNAGKSAFSKNDVTIGLQNAIMTLNEYFTEGNNND